MNILALCIVYYILLYVATLNFCAPWYVTQLKSRTGMPSGVSGSGHEPADHYNSSDSAFWWNQFGHGFVWTCMNISYTHSLPLWENHEQPTTTIGSWGTFFSDKATCLGRKMGGWTIRNLSWASPGFRNIADQLRSIFRWGSQLYQRAATSQEPMNDG